MVMIMVVVVVELTAMMMVLLMTKVTTLMSLYSNWSLQMGQMGPKMTLGTLKMNGNDFPGV